MEELDGMAQFALGTFGGLLSVFRCREGLLETNSSRFCRRSLRISWALVDGGGAATMVDIVQLRLNGGCCSSLKLKASNENEEKIVPTVSTTCM